jgi:hypothetical protein
MGMVAVFALGCCGREVVAGRFKGHDENPPTKPKCPFGCEPRFLFGKLQRVKMEFLRHESEDMIAPELLATWEWRPRNNGR